MDPMVTLINLARRHPAEITAGGISATTTAAKLVGETTFGTGTVLHAVHSLGWIDRAAWYRLVADARLAMQIWKVRHGARCCCPAPPDADQIRPSSDKPSYTID